MERRARLPSTSSFRPSLRRHSWQSSSSSISSWSALDDEEGAPMDKTVVSRRKIRPSIAQTSFQNSDAAKQGVVALDLASYVNSDRESPLASPISSPEFPASIYVSKLSLSSPSSPSSKKEQEQDQTPIRPSRTKSVVSGFIPSPDRIQGNTSPLKSGVWFIDSPQAKGGDGSPRRTPRQRNPTPWPAKIQAPVRRNDSGEEGSDSEANDKESESDGTRDSESEEEI